MPETPNKFYLTTPIYYVNARPHIGHAYTTIAADVIARRHRLLGEDTFFLTGTDEHGQKIERAAAAQGIPPQQYADQVSASFSALWKRMGITNDKFIRTTDERHQRGVQKLFSILKERGFIELRTYTGQYSVGEEMFVEGPPGTIGPDGKPTETISEENFFFKLSEFQLPLINLIESNTLLIQPESRRNEVLSFLRSGLKDLSISRSSFTWGVPVPEPAASEAKEKHVIYVWLDALANYMTAIGYGSDEPADLANFEKYWPADLHLVGKEIIRFHCVYWPAFLMAAELPLPKSIVAHGWLLFEESKMSKSRGNVVRTETILDTFGTLKPKPLDGPGPEIGDEYWKHEQDLFAADVLRYFLLREIPFGQDGSFSFDALITRYNADLANGYGNLVSRTLKLIDKSRQGIVPKRRDANLIDIDDATKTADLISWATKTIVQFSENFEAYRFSTALEILWTFVAIVDGYISVHAPWKLASYLDDLSQSKLDEVLYTSSDSIRIVTALLYPILPYATASVWRQLGLGDIEEAARNGELKDLKWGGLKPGTKLGALAPIFPRADKGLAQIMTDMENPITPPAPTPAPEAKSSEPTAEALNAVHPVATAAAETQPSNLEPRASDPITIDDFAKVDLRVAQIVVAERIPKADKLLRLEVDLGPSFSPPRRQILAGIAEYYAPETLVGRKVVIVANLAPRKMRGLESQGMIVAASLGPAGAPVLAGFLEDVELGARLK